MNQLLTKTAFVIISLLMFINQSCNNNNKDTFRFVQMCDPQLGMGGYTHDTIAFKNAIEQINELKPDFVVICGDLVDSSCNASFDDFNRIKLDFEIPVHIAAGNHDVENVPTKETLAYYRSKIGKDYYSFDFAENKFIVVNTQLWKAPLEEESEKHDIWFQNMLENAKKEKKPVFIIGHYPLFVEQLNEEENYFNLPIKKRLELFDLYKRHGVIAHLGGHVHKTLEHKIENIQFVNAETTSLNFDNRPLGFRLWTVMKDSVSNKLIELADIPTKEIRMFNNTDSLTKNTGTR